MGNSIQSMFQSLKRKVNTTVSTFYLFGWKGLRVRARVVEEPQQSLGDIAGLGCVVVKGTNRRAREELRLTAN